MIIRHFLKWIDGACVAQRCAAASALAHAYLQSDLSSDDRRATEAALTLLLEDTSPKVRAALSESLSLSRDAPLSLVTALAGEQVEISGFMLARSPLLSDMDMIDRVAMGDEAAQRLIAMRPQVSLVLSAAIAEVASPTACVDLLRNSTAQIAPMSLRRMAERLGAEPSVREALLRHENLPADSRHMLAVRIGEALAGMQIVTATMGKGRAERVARDTCIKVSLDIADRSAPQDHAALVEHLRERGDLTTALIIRTVAYGKIDFFGAILVALSDQPRSRVGAILTDGRDNALAALFRSAGLADATHRPLITALHAWRQVVKGKLVAGPWEISRKMLSTDSRFSPANGDLEALLRSIHLDAARENARDYAVAMLAA
ncbi:DUF2336 domain-containing protein [Phyllobacterium leguminum]|uniref:Uncharacterized protein (DUF2336 family) n=1 Tax=Phyllobacterium leguminum TaxID=314237 RepID=A0A318T597_9HYPH|nr:DUF2336 domain-containing protein [Phyllobacterium leguminum]PYE88202.1 uncharacterized protein (DUF2336 family) [Phyllobacterium leguminum]